MSAAPVINLADVPLRDGGNGDAFKARVGTFAHLIGLEGLGCMLHVVEPGEKAFPFHSHHQIDEVFIVLEGEGTLRYGDQRHPVRAGDVIGAPTGGPETAHQIINTGPETLKYLGVSTMAETEVAEYPDSGKFAVISRFDWNNPGAGGLRFVGRRDQSVDYFDGEE